MPETIPLCHRRSRQTKFQPLFWTAPHDTLFHPYGFASQDLMNDLFENLGVAQSEFFLSQARGA